MDDRDAEALIWRLREAKSPHPCNLCKAACCRDLDVEVMIDDIEDIASFLELPFAEVRERHTTAEPTRHLEGVPIYELKKDAEGWCPFSREVAGKKRICGVHIARPVACRDYSAWTCTRREVVL